MDACLVQIACQMDEFGKWKTMCVFVCTRADVIVIVALIIITLIVIVLFILRK